MSVQKFLDKIKNGRYGADITDAIIGGIKKCYDDASVNHDNANMEVKMARGTHNTLNDRLDNVDEIQAQTNAQLSAISKVGYQSQIKEFFDSIQDHDHLTFESEMLLNEQILVEKTIRINGNGKRIYTTAEGINYLLKFQNVKKLVIKDVVFDSNSKGRGLVFLKNCKNVIFENCEFTGYTLEYGYYKTDSAVLVEDCTNVKFIDCYFHDIGFDVGISTDELNRCITTQGDCDAIKIINNTFENVNQGVVSTSGSILIDGNNFKNVRDNSLYLWNTYAKIVNNHFNDEYDESVVISNGHYLIKNNTFLNVPNKMIAINGSVSSVKVVNNEFFSNLSVGEILAFRDLSAKCPVLFFESNHIRMHNYDNSNRVISIGNVDALKIKDNSFSLKLQTHQKLIYLECQNLISCELSDNVVNNSGNYDALLIDFGVAPSDSLKQFIYKNNALVNIRSKQYSFITYDGVDLQVNAGPYIRTSKLNNTYYSDTLPTIGYYYVGDRILKNTASEYMGWVCVKEGDGATAEWNLILNTKVRSRAGTPINWLAPRFIGEEVFDTANNEWYKGVGLTQTDWKKITT